MWHPDPDQLTLAALPAEQPDPQVTAHLADCRLCAGQVESLRRTVELARDSSDGVDDGPPDRVWQAITDELSIDDVVAEPPRRARGWQRVVVPAATAVLGVLVGLVVGYAASTPAQPAGPVARLAPVGALDPVGAGEARMTGAGPEERMEVELTGVDDLAGGDYLQVWLLDGTGSRLVSLGGLSPVPTDPGSYRGTFTIPAGLPLGQYGTVDVSVERWDGDPGHSQQSVLRGPVA